MTYLYWYLGIGAAALVIIFTSHRLAKSKNEADFSELIDSFDPRHDRWWWKPLNKLVVPLLAAVTVVVAWPIAIYWKAKEMIDAGRPHIEEDPPKEFEVTKEHLQRRWTVAEVEEVEVVLDPLGAAPRVPFGHLNPAWEAFKQSITEDDQLWSFSASRTTEWGLNEVRGGYAVLRDEAIGAHFLSHRVSLDHQLEED
jgi:hypothetical protein